MTFWKSSHTEWKERPPFYLNCSLQCHDPRVGTTWARNGDHNSCSWKCTGIFITIYTLQFIYHVYCNTSFQKYLKQFVIYSKFISCKMVFLYSIFNSNVCVLRMSCKIKFVKPVKLDTVQNVQLVTLEL